MSVQLYEGCWGVTRGGETRGPIDRNVNGYFVTHPFRNGDSAWTKNGAWNDIGGLESPDDIIAVFATEAEADAYLAQESHKPLGQIVREEYDRLRAKDLSGVKHAVNAPSFTFAPAPKPVTWPDGVTKMTIGPHQITIDAETGVIQVVWHGSVGSTPAQARQLAALLLAAADKVEGRG